MNKQLDFLTYQEAWAYAKDYAEKNSKTTTLVRSGDQWRVLYEETALPKYVASEARAVFDDEDFAIDESDVFDDEDFVIGESDDAGEKYCDFCDTPIGSSNECYNCEID